MLHFCIPGQLPSNNQLIRAHWARRSRLKSGYLSFIRAQLNEPFPEKAAKVRSHVDIVAFLRRRYDKDNLHGGAKILIDALRAAKLIYQDSPRWLDLDVRQELDHENMRIEVTVKSSMPPSGGSSQ